MLVDHPNVRKFITRVRESHAEAFTLHSKTAVFLEDTFFNQHPHGDELGLTLDMLFLQGYKAHLSVMRLAELALVEDAATITRRLLELSIQGAYMTHPSAAQGRRRRAGQYLAFMWRKFPRRFRQGFPPALRAEWSRIARSYGRFVPAKARTWGPNWRDMFDQVGQLPTYTSDYSFLSAIAHGRPDEQIIAFSAPKVQVTPHHHVSTLLVFASRYYLGLAIVWDSYHHLLNETKGKQLLKELIDWTRRQ